ncbi:YcaO-like family protein [Salmonella enterica]|nr:YcaO-like family protein [Salmonella enterica]EKC2533763.1 YcaO-like family protein [Salmonella enterica]EMD3382500.1 YcaO-like family protein [Salmonella enterica]EMD3422877.1 YcaO-like family protein [Salmonella enterica]EMD3477337.1 YcaO-like family protein [Salmonella enterica]
MLGPRFFRVSYDLSANLNAPKMTRIHLEKGIASCATGYDLQVRTRSAGEALERHLCYCDSEFSCGKAKISELDDDIAEWFCSTIPMSGSIKNNEHHEYNVVSVKELVTQKIYRAPLVAFTLGSNEDDAYYGFRDSSGTALHKSPELAFLGARNEYCERQALSLFWYYGHCLSCIQLTGENADYVAPVAHRFIHHLLSNGKIYLIDISLIHPVRTILAVYLSKNGPVYYSAGASGAEQVEHAVEKSLLELYQAYVLMLNICSDSAKKIVTPDDEIITGYVSYNHMDFYAYWESVLLRKCNQEKDKFSDSVLCNNNFESERIFSLEKSIIFPNAAKNVYFCCLKGMDGFSVMSLDKGRADINDKAARHYGCYSHMINKGPIAFA